MVQNRTAKTWKNSYALSFYRSQNILGWSKSSVPDQRFIYILWQSQKFCARQRDDLHSVKLFIVPAQKFLKRTKCSQIFGLPQKIRTGTKRFGTFKRTWHQKELGRTKLVVWWFDVTNKIHFLTFPADF